MNQRIAKRLWPLFAAILILCVAMDCSQKDTQAEERIAELEAVIAALQEELANVRAEVASQPMQKSETAFPVPGKWKITGTARNGSFTLRAYMTIADITGTEFGALIDWHDPAGSVAKENVKGTYDPQNRQVTLTRGYGVKVDADVFKGLFDNIDGETFTAHLAENNIDIINGKWMDDGEWEAHWPENGVDFPEEYNPPMDFRPGWAYEDF